jgi:hypothetical protein
VSVVPLLGLVLDVRNIDRDAALFLFRCIVDAVEGPKSAQPFSATPFCDRGCQGRFAVVDMPHGAHVHVGFAPIKLLLAHSCSPYMRRNQQILE